MQTTSDIPDRSKSQSSIAHSSASSRARRQTWPMNMAQLHNEKTKYEFEAQGSVKHLQRLERAREKGGDYSVNRQILFLGIAAFVRENNQIDIGFTSHDGTYSVDFALHTISPKTTFAPDGSHAHTSDDDHDEIAESIADYVLDKLKEYEKEHMYKFVGAGINKTAATISPQLPARLWAELDAVPLVFQRGLETDRGLDLTADEEADTMARKCLMMFGPGIQPRVVVGFRNIVEVDASAHARLTTLQQYIDSVSPQTWKAVSHYARSLKERNIKIAFFNSTPQGGGVALMRHALIRFFRVLGVNCSWYVPKPKPEVFRITKTNHNILQGVADPSSRLSSAQRAILEEWATSNAQRYWTVPNGPLASRDKGGADVIIVDDPQMPNLIVEARKQDSTRSILFRSHIQIRSDLADKPGTPTSEVWNWVWDSARHADVFISHPVAAFVPSSVPKDKVAYMPATTDWLDGLNKELSSYDSQHYIQEFNTECYKSKMTKLAFPARDYIVQIARFDPSKGIPDVLASYAEFRRTYLPSSTPKNKIPQLVVAGHGAIDDPDASLILDQTMELLDTKYSDLKQDVVVMRLGPTDQLLNALLSNAKVALQLSTREGFEVKVSEALHKGIPIIATLAGGIPLQVTHEKNGFLVEPGDYKAVAGHLATLFKDEEVYRRMSRYAARHVSDEVSTVGNALCWMYLADALTKGEKVVPKGRWVADLAREAAGVPWESGEDRLPRNVGA
ncbi:UDP-Glycosyltransferase/glycogen phosphorylase [Rhizodiscina lignyota]|uniref:UDP-Glycosyltransferase/glycogen phosphorylase n=1 Tax=Rhizodiscina lignyota TaxID=1504668 RepID=A0A9P4I2U8_9PEZI|nr:UDP-Glycosyltransferase/glycogen phosphorylase [Rhizodiscina lignyota]